MYPGTHAAVTPDRPAVIMADSGEVLTYRDLDERSMRLAQLLGANGLNEGDRIAILAENHIRYFEAYWAAIRSGLYVTGVNWHLTAAEAAYIVSNSGAKALVTTAAQAGTGGQILPDLPGCRVRLIIDGAAPGFEPYRAGMARPPGVGRQAAPRHAAFVR
jgi:long-chain acyl-CoA synthetase